eukprot:GFKZ01012635.1.p1 GENE.GFKZ01012635.1~~GFKZ01012635.1.p1  ORF type:complete len:520 (-),score=45.00 GFKZ01012635.1:1272-2831(-)
MASPKPTEPSFPAASTASCTPLWHVTGTSITPSAEFTQSLNAFCAKSRADDPTIRFIFSSPSTCYPEPPALQDFVHVSRLSFADGPLGALVHRDFSERQTRTVNLCPEDDPTTFAIIRDFLYGIQIHLAALPLPNLLRVMRSAHRWELDQLFGALCLYISTRDLFCDAPSLLMAVDIVALPDLPNGLRDYFWNSAAKFFPELSSLEFRPHPPPDPIAKQTVNLEAPNSPTTAQTDADAPPTLALSADDKPDLDAVPINHRLCPHFPDIWDLALAHGALVRFIDDIRKLAVPGLNASLLDLVVRYLEARIPDDDTVFALLELLGPDAMRQAYLFDRGIVDNACSARAVRLLAKSLIAPTEPTHSMSFSWDMVLGTLAPCRKNFLYGACDPASRGSRSRWDPNLFEAGRAIHVHIESVSKTATHTQTMKREVKEVAFTIRWDVSPCFPLKGRKMELNLRMMARKGGEAKMGTMLYDINRWFELTQKTGTFQEVAESCCFDGVDVENGDFATLVLNMRLTSM